MAGHDERDPAARRAARPTGARWLAVVAAVLLLIVVPWALLDERVAALASAFIARRPPAWLSGPGFALLLAADVLLPVPSSLIGIAAGASLGLTLGALASWVGMTLGCLLGYGLGLRAGRPSVRRLVSEEEERRFEQAAARYGVWLVAVFRAVPVLAEASVLFAGMARLPFRRFLLTSALSNLAISLTYAAVGHHAAEVDSFLIAFVGAVALPFAAMALLRARE